MDNTANQSWGGLDWLKWIYEILGKVVDIFEKIAEFINFFK